MKTILPVFILLLCGLGNSFAGQPTGTTQVSLPAPTAYTSTPQDGNSCIWERTVYTLNSAGAVVPENHSYIQLEAGMNHLVNGQWIPSKEEIDLQPDGWAAATNGEYQAWFPGDIYQSAVTIVGPKGQILQCRPEILCYVDGTNYAIIATAQDSDGVLVNSNTVIYPGAFTNLNASVRYVYHPSGFEQDIILHQQPPDPQSLGLNPQTTCIAVFSECFDPPDPTSDGIFTDPASGLQDTSLDFDGMHLTMGKAFSTADTNQAAVEGAPVYKSWLTTSEGRTFLIEKVPYHNIAQPLSQLPLQSSINAQPANHTLYAVSQMLPPARPLKKNAGSIRFAQKTADSTSGVVLDYVLLPVSLVNQTFQADTTYLMGPYYFELDGTVTFEGASVIKFQSSTAQLKLNNFNVVCLSGPYRPIILTAQDDNTVGETVSGSTGNPSGYYGQGISMFNNTNLTVFHDVRMSYLNLGFVTWVPTEFDNIQAINCSTPITHAGNDVAINNGLFYNITGTAVSSAGFNCAVRGTHLTVDICNAFTDSTTTILGLTNCLFTSTTNLLPGTGTLTTNDVANLANNSGIYQIVGAGSHYLASGSPYHASGNTNISATILASLAMKTTYPPVVYSNVTLSSAMTFNPQAQRDNMGWPDLGYHYDPLDYCFGGVTATTNLNFTAGTAIGWFELPGTYGAGYGIGLPLYVTVTYNGTATAPCVQARYSVVQEGGNGLWTDKGYLGGILANSYNPDLASYVNATFTHFAELANDPNNVRDNGCGLALTANDCEFWSGDQGGYGMIYSLTNCLFDRTYLALETSSAEGLLAMRNCTMHGSVLSSTHDYGATWPTWIENCSFDGTDLSGMDDPSGGNTNITYCDFNAFITNDTRLPILGTHDVLVTNFNWQTSWFGNFYLPSNSPLINSGSTTADQVGLYHFTTQTNQTVEGTTTVDIGYHYVATDSYGNPLDSNGNGIPDYIEDSTGSGMPMTITLVSPTNGTAYSEPASIPISATVLDWASVVTNVNFYQGTNAITSVTNTPYQYVWPIVASGTYLISATVEDAAGSITNSETVTVTVTNLNCY